jgi:miniconductance mechanosensitive channel
MLGSWDNLIILNYLILIKKTTILERFGGDNLDFRDTILVLLSVQVSINDMVRIEDWITMDKFGAD